jgi:protein-disulfide isomerase
MSRNNVKYLVSALMVVVVSCLGAAALIPYDANAQGVAADTLLEKADRGRIAGDTNAKVWVIMVADFECSACHLSFKAVDSMLMKDYVKTGKIQLAFLPFPLKMHPNAFQAATAALCASVQGKFWEYHDGLFNTHPQWKMGPRSGFIRIADSLATATGLNVSAWKSCVSSGKMRARIEADESSIVRLGIDTTPSFLIDEKLVVGYVTPAKLRSMIDEALAKKSVKGTR